MITISLPHALEGLLWPLQRAFDIGASVGLGTVTFTIHPNASDQIAIALEETQYRIVIDSDAISLSDCDDYMSDDDVESICFQYRNAVTQTNPSTVLANRFLRSDFILRGVYVDIASQGDTGQIAERWLMLESDETFSFSSCCRFDYSSLSVQLSHLAWFIAALCMKFSLQDSLLIAQAGRKVSRETWVESQFDFLNLEPLNELSCVENDLEYQPFPAVDISKFNLYPVLDDEALIHQLIDLGVTTIQLRDKTPNSNYQDKVKRVIVNAKEKQVQLFINDDWELAIAYHAYGVHLGQEDLTTADLNRLSQSGLRLGISTHSYFEIIRAIGVRPSYIALGHIFPTQTKSMPSLPQGTQRLALYQGFIQRTTSRLNLDIATVAIGGINLENVAGVLASGVDAVAVVTALTQSTDVANSVMEFNIHLNRRKRGR